MIIKRANYLNSVLSEKIQAFLLSSHPVQVVVEYERVHARKRLVLVKKDVDTRAWRE